MSIKGVVRGIAASILLALLPESSALAQAVDGGFRVFRPDGTGPHPAVILLPGCFGMTPDYAPKAFERRSEEFRARGFVVVWADYLGRRNLKSCREISKAEAGRDAVAAAAWLKAQPSVDPKRIAAMGWTFGGGSVLQALSDHRATELGFTRAIVFYPNCAAVGPWPSSIPVLVLQADSDNVAPNDMCKFAFDNPSVKKNIKVIKYPGTYHGFDIPELPAKHDYAFGTMGYHSGAAAAASEEVLRFLGAMK
jgi:dienelactone hydrolase